jgi:hypothetical protein
VTLPLLLAGPIVRRASEDEVWIWVATSRQVVDVEPALTVYKTTKTKYTTLYDVDESAAYDRGRVPLSEPPNLSWDPKPFRSVALGQNLYVSLIGLWPKARTFPLDRVLGYNLKLTLANDKGERTAKWVVPDLIEEDAVAYPYYPEPTFYLPSSNSILAHASCRRPGGDGPDAFVDLDIYCVAHSEDVTKRPSALFLTGDQIYADEVAPALFASIRQLSTDLMGYDEYLPTTYGSNKQYAFEVPAGDIVYTTAQALDDAKKRASTTFGGQDAGLLGTRRGNVLKHGFTTDKGEGHLLTFGEFAAMYLLVWNPALATLYGLEKNLAKSGDDQNLVGFTKAIAAALRVLANTPTYMIFDDHEITDDWNINKKWVEQTDNLFARRVIANGLAAYWAFQDWGTNPSGYGSRQNTIIDLVQKHLEKQLTSGGKLYRFNDRDFGKPMLAWTDWAYVTDTKPQVVVADMRTHRRFKYRDRAHMDGEVEEKFSRFLSRYVTPKAPLFLVLASPLLGWQPVLKVRDVGLKLEGGALEKEVGDLFDDIPEGQMNLVRLIQQLADPTICVVFSGDVHFSHVELGWVRAEDHNRILWQMPIVQVTSSPLKNEEERLNKKRFRTTTGNLLEEAIPIKARNSDLGHYPNLTLEWQSQRLSGKLGHEFVIPKNASCLVSLVGPKRVHVVFLGRKAQAQCDVNV